MFLDFVTGLVILTISFRLVIMVVAILPALLLAALGRWRTDSIARRNALLNQAILAAIYSVVIAVTARLYATQVEVMHPWIYAIAGFVGTFLVLAGGVQARTKAINESGSSPLPVAEGAAQGAVIGLPVALIVYPVFYAFPILIGVLPSVVGFLQWVLEVSRFLGSIWLVRVVVLLGSIGYILAGLVTVLVTMSIIVHGIRSAVTRFSHARQAE
jgi:hypothetical protein